MDPDVDSSREISFRCHGCNQEMKVAVEAQGRTDNCPTCGRVVVIPDKSQMAFATLNAPDLKPISGLNTSVELGSTPTSNKQSESSYTGPASLSSTFLFASASMSLILLYVCQTYIPRIGPETARLYRVGNGMGAVCAAFMAFMWLRELTKLRGVFAVVNCSLLHLLVGTCAFLVVTLITAVFVFVLNSVHEFYRLLFRIAFVALCILLPFALLYWVLSSLRKNINKEVVGGVIALVVVVIIACLINL